MFVMAHLIMGGVDGMKSAFEDDSCLRLLHKPVPHLILIITCRLPGDVNCRTWLKTRLKAEYLVVKSKLAFTFN